MNMNIREVLIFNPMDPCDAWEANLLNESIIIKDKYDY